MADYFEALNRSQAALDRLDAATRKATEAEYTEIQRILKQATRQLWALFPAGQETDAETVRRAAEFRELIEAATALLQTAADNTANRLDHVTTTALALARQLTENELEEEPPPPEETPESSATKWALLAAALLGPLVLGERLEDLKHLMGFRAREAVTRIERVLVQGAREGRNFNTVADQVLKVIGLEAQRALTMNRTEMMRAYREATRLDLVRSPHAAQGWTWLAVLDSRCCAICWANHGRQFAATEPMPAHPRCRCVIVPTSQLPQGIKTGPATFAELPQSERERILGPAASRAYDAGLIGLEDVVSVRRHPQWGQTGVRVPLRDLVGSERAKELRYLK